MREAEEKFDGYVHWQASCILPKTRRGWPRYGDLDPSSIEKMQDELLLLTGKRPVQLHFESALLQVPSTPPPLD